MGMGFFNIFNGVFGLFFVLFIIVFIFILIRIIREWGKNNGMPKIPAEATVISKRAQTHHHHHDNGHMHTDHSYYIGFEYINGERIEAKVRRGDYSQFIEGDRGILTMQGTRFIGFERR